MQKLVSIDAKTGVAASVANGYDRYQISLQFATESNHDGVNRIEVSSAAANLTVKYLD